MVRALKHKPACVFAQGRLGRKRLNHRQGARTRQRVPRTLMQHPTSPSGLPTPVCPWHSPPRVPARSEPPHPCAADPSPQQRSKRRPTSHGRPCEAIHAPTCAHGPCKRRPKLPAQARRQRHAQRPRPSTHHLLRKDLHPAIDCSPLTARRPRWPRLPERLSTRVAPQGLAPRPATVQANAPRRQHCRTAA